MTGPVPRPRDPMSPFVAAGFVLVVAGVLAWMWLGEWRYVATGVALFVVCAAIGAARGGTR